MIQTYEITCISAHLAIGIQHNILIGRCLPSLIPDLASTPPAAPLALHSPSTGSHGVAQIRCPILPLLPLRRQH
jgi:hypothetical protein